MKERIDWRARAKAYQKEIGAINMANSLHQRKVTSLHLWASILQEMDSEEAALKQMVARRMREIALRRKNIVSDMEKELKKYKEGRL